MTPECRATLARAVAVALDTARVRLPPRAHARFLDALVEALDAEQADRTSGEAPS